MITELNSRIQLTYLSDIKAIAGTYALKKDNTVWDFSTGTCIQVPELTNIVSISGSWLMDFTVHAIKLDGTVYALGSNKHGQYGDGTKVSSDIPVIVPQLKDFKMIEYGWNHCIGINGDNAVFTWGNNNAGQLGGNNGEDYCNRPSPNKISNLQNVSSIANGLKFGMAIKGDGTVWSWGDNSFGQLGFSEAHSVSTPTKIPELSNAKWLHVVLILALSSKMTGTVWTRGKTLMDSLEMEPTIIEAHLIRS